MNTYTWSITRIVCKTQLNANENVVLSVQWRCIGSDGVHTSIKFDKCNIPYDPSGSFTPYADLTESQILSWVWSVINKSEIESKVDEMLECRTNPVVSLPLPWNS